jgi:hypothetical protein
MFALDTAQKVRVLAAAPYDLGQRAADDLATVEGRDGSVIGGQVVWTPGRIADVVVGRLAGMDNARSISTSFFFCLLQQCSGLGGGCCGRPSRPHGQWLPSWQLYSRDGGKQNPHQ